MKRYSGSERRRYIRLKSVFPVEFRVLSLDEKEDLSDFLQGFTADVSRGGILLHVYNLKAELADILKEKKVKLQLNINIPLAGKPVKTISTVAWTVGLKEDGRNLSLIGLAFEKIEDRDRNKLAGYAASLYRAPKLTAIAISLMLIALGINRAEEARLWRENSLLVERLTQVLQKRSAVVELLDRTDEDRETLLAKLKRQSGEIAKIEEERKKLLEEEEKLKASVMDLEVLKAQLKISQEAQTALESQLEKLTLGKTLLQQELDSVKEREEGRLKELEKIERARLKLEVEAVNNMYNWLKTHQNRRTGLIASYEGDPALKNTGFIYDQSLVAQTFLLNNDIEDARDILDFFKDRARRKKGGFANAYGVNNGAITEPVVHSGPNIWLGLALMQYVEKTGQREYLKLAEDIADWVIGIQNEDPGGGIRGGPEFSWFGTEHNLDAYAFFTILSQRTNREKYKKAAQKSLNWIKAHTYTGSEGRIYRGRGDSTIATDTFTWAIAAIGPKTLIDNGMDPDAIMKFAEDNCKVTVDFVRPDGKAVKITGFDFAKHKNIARGGVVSSEWTAQMIVSLKMMSDFYSSMGDYDKAKFYRNKWNFYLNEVEKMIVASPSRSGQGAGCLPYATQGNADTGHGWRTPKGRDTGSVSGTAYAIFAIKGYNPLKLKEEK